MHVNVYFAFIALGISNEGVNPATTLNATHTVKKWLQESELQRPEWVYQQAA